MTREEVLKAVDLARKARCGYIGKRCDCKYGSGGSEQTGCPELRELGALLSRISDEQWGELESAAFDESPTVRPEASGDAFGNARSGLSDLEALTGARAHDLVFATKGQVSEVGSAEYWHERFSRCLGVLEETQSQLAAALAKVAELERQCKGAQAAYRSAEAELDACKIQRDQARQELADVHALDELANRHGTRLDIPAKIPGFDPGDGSDHLHFVLMPIGARSRRAAVEYLKKEGKDG